MREEEIALAWQRHDLLRHGGYPATCPPPYLGSERLKFKETLCEAQNWRCCYCGFRMERADATLEHVYPRVYGGTDHISNLVICCEACNRFRGHFFYNLHYEAFGYMDKKLAGVKSKLRKLPATPVQAVEVALTCSDALCVQEVVDSYNDTGTDMEGFIEAIEQAQDKAQAEGVAYLLVTITRDRNTQSRKGQSK